jgi:undecaprenyl-diphosphatase
LRLAEAGAGTSLFDLADLVGDAAILLLLAVAGVAFWRARKQINQMARLIAGLAGAVFAYGLSELLKLLIQQARPCASLPALAAVDCPPADDWSLPSNHAAIALALTSAILLTAPRLWPLAAPIAFVAMVSRVAAGEHYVHDVVDGAILGALTTITLVALLSLPVRALLRAIARVPMLAPIFFAGPRN